MNNYLEAEFKKIKQTTNQEYLSVGFIYNTALKSKIFFNSNGWHHLRYDNNRSERSRLVQLNKFRFLKDAIATIKKSTTIQEYRRSEVTNWRLKKESTIEWFAFWSIISFIKKTRIRVIVRRVGGLNGQYHFWSVMPFWSLKHGERKIGSANLEDE